ncbi:MAG: flagellar hook-associated protein 3 [Curvibacter sp. GWA2_64_110]|nr:MAG: flagellar hook-associated protein 3 [Curvibacter sp. GWA2_64_110]HCY17551.1 flagellar hook-associated protein 3 [Curvibacter sp.]
MSMRLGSANAFDNSLAQLTSHQAGLADLQEKLTAGKRVLRPSDDPTAAAQAERAMTRISRIETEQRALNVQKNSMSMAESTLGNATETLQAIRDLVVGAGNAGYTSVNRTSIAQQISALRDQLFGYANKVDSNGVPLFGGLGSASAPFTDSAAGVAFNGIAGQTAGSAVSIPSAMDGQAVWMNVPSGNGVFDVSLGGTNTGTVWTDVGQVTNPSAVTGDNYTVTFNVVAGVTTYDVVDTTTATTVSTGQPYTSGQTIQFGGMSIKAEGVPANGDTLQIAPSSTTNIFKVIDQAMAGINGANNSNKLNQAFTRALAEIDTGMNRIQSARGLAGDMLNRADNIESTQTTKSVQLETDRSRAEDIDMIKGISDFQNQQTGYDAALKTYAQVQRLSLFNYLG